MQPDTSKVSSTISTSISARDFSGSLAVDLCLREAFDEAEALQPTIVDAPIAKSTQNTAVKMEMEMLSEGCAQKTADQPDVEVRAPPRRATALRCALHAAYRPVQLLCMFSTR